MSMALIVTQEQAAVTYKILDSILADVDESSRYTYRQAIEQYLAWVLRQRENPYYNAYTLLVDYRSFLKELYAPATVNKRLSAVRKLYEFAASYNLIDYAQSVRIKGLKNVENDEGEFKIWLAQDVASQLFNAPDTTTVIGRRDKTALLLLLVLCLRREEAVNVRWEQLKQVEGRWFLLNVKGKSKDSRSIRIPDQYMSILEAWKNDGTSDYILTSVGRDSKKGERLSKTSVNTKIVNKYRDQLGIDVTPHALRRTGATIAVRQGAQVEQVRKMLGHQTERTTRIYLQDALELDDSATQYIEL